MPQEPQTPMRQEARQERERGEEDGESAEVDEEARVSEEAKDGEPAATRQLEAFEGIHRELRQGFGDRAAEALSALLVGRRA